MAKKTIAQVEIDDAIYVHTKLLRSLCQEYKAGIWSHWYLVKVANRLLYFRDDNGCSLGNRLRKVDSYVKHSGDVANMDNIKHFRVVVLIDANLAH